MKEIELRLKKKTTIDPTTNCWLYTGYLNEKGYGIIEYLGFCVGVHRISAFLYHKLDLNDSEIHALHKLECSNKNCWNPDHIYLGTNSDNMVDKLLKGG